MEVDRREKKLRERVLELEKEESKRQERDQRLKKAWEEITRYKKELQVALGAGTDTLTLLEHATESEYVQWEGMQRVGRGKVLQNSQNKVQETQAFAVECNMKQSYSKEIEEQLSDDDIDQQKEGVRALSAIETKTKE